MGTTRKKKKKSSSKTKSSGGGGSSGVMMSMRSGFKNAAHRAVGAGAKKTKKQTTLSKTLNWVATAILLGVAVWLLARRLGYI